MAPIRVAAFVPYPLGSVPSQRFRIEQWAPLMREQGIEFEFRPFASHGLVRLLYRHGATFGKVLGLARATLSQARRLPARGAFDVAVVHRGACLVGPAFLERRLAGVGPLIYDFDDAIHLLHTSEANRAFGWLKYPTKTAHICELADSVVVGNEYLARFASKHNADVTVVPSSVDSAVYTPGPRREARDRPVIGWMGSSTSQTYLEPFAPLLRRIAESGFVVRIISDRRPSDFAFPFEWKPWSAEAEVGELRDFDVGIMPLPDTEWAKGKCAMKILQYMGVGVPSIGSALGGNLEVIRDGENGLLATSDDEWMEKISRVARNPLLAQRLGEAGRDTLVARYSAGVCADRFAEVVRRVVYASRSSRPRDARRLATSS